MWLIDSFPLSGNRTNSVYNLDGKKIANRNIKEKYLLRDSI